MDAYSNLAFGRVLVAPTPPTTGTSIEVLLGQGQRFPAPPFNATVWPVTDFPQPTLAEIVRVTARTGDVFTVVRGQEGTVAQAIGAGYAFASSITKLMIDALRNASNINAGTLDSARLAPDVVLRSQVPEAWPVFSIFITVAPVNPNALLGYGTWMAFGQGRVLVGLNAADAEFNVVEKAGGAKAHTLTIAEMPYHNHGGLTGTTATAASATGATTTGADSPDHGHVVYDPTHSHQLATNAGPGSFDHIGPEEAPGNLYGRYTEPAATNIRVDGATVRHYHGIPALSIPALSVGASGIAAEGGGAAHNNLQPYVTVYMWKRTA